MWWAKVVWLVDQTHTSTWQPLGHHNMEGRCSLLGAYMLAALKCPWTSQETTSVSKSSFIRMLDLVFWPLNSSGNGYFLWSGSLYFPGQSHILEWPTTVTVALHLVLGWIRKCVVCLLIAQSASVTSLLSSSPVFVSSAEFLSKDFIFFFPGHW